MDDPEEMYRRVPWLTPADPVILEFLRLNGRQLELSPSCIARNIGYSQGHVADRLRELQGRELVERADRGYYRLTVTGIALVDGEIQPEDLIEDDEDEGGGSTPP